MSIYDVSLLRPIIIIIIFLLVLDTDLDFEKGLANI